MSSNSCKMQHSREQYNLFPKTISRHLVTGELWHSITLSMEIRRLHSQRFVVCDRQRIILLIPVVVKAERKVTDCFWQVANRVRSAVSQVSPFSVCSCKRTHFHSTDRTDPACEEAWRKPWQTYTFNLTTLTYNNSNDTNLSDDLDAGGKRGMSQLSCCLGVFVFFGILCLNKFQMFDTLFSVHGRHSTVAVVKTHPHLPNQFYPCCLRNWIPHKPFLTRSPAQGSFTLSHCFRNKSTRWTSTSGWSSILALSWHFNCRQVSTQMQRKF